MNNIDEKDKLRSKLKKALEGAISDFYKNDGDLVQLGGIEWSCVFRIGIYLHERMQKDDELKELSLDCEYNKSETDTKKLDGKQVRPDLVIHKRLSNESNRLIVEFKGWWNDKEDDIEKLKKFTNPDYKYSYQLAAFVKLEKSSATCEYFKDGKRWGSKNKVYGV